MCVDIRYRNKIQKWMLSSNSIFNINLFAAFRTCFLIIDYFHNNHQKIMSDDKFRHHRVVFFDKLVLILCGVNILNVNLSVDHMTVFLIFSKLKLVLIWWEDGMLKKIIVSRRLKQVFGQSFFSVSWSGEGK